MTTLLLAAATIAVRAVLLVVIVAALGFIAVLLAEQVHQVRTSISKENHRHDRTHV